MILFLHVSAAGKGGVLTLIIWSQSRSTPKVRCSVFDDKWGSGGCAYRLIGKWRETRSKQRSWWGQEGSFQAWTISTKVLPPLLPEAQPPVNATKRASGIMTATYLWFYLPLTFWAFLRHSEWQKLIGSQLESGKAPTQRSRERNVRSEQYYVPLHILGSTIAFLAQHITAHTPSTCKTICPSSPCWLFLRTPYPLVSPETSEVENSRSPEREKKIALSTSLNNSRTQHLVCSSCQIIWLEPNHEETSDKPTSRDTLHENPPGFFKRVNVINMGTIEPGCLAYQSLL